jgi:predicted metal-dependent peptidase
VSPVELDAKTKKACNDKLAIARATIANKYPFMTDMVYALIPHPTDRLPKGIGTGVTRLGVLLFDPQVILAWTTEDVVTGYLHEAEHIIRRHHQLADALGIEPSERELMNYAEDMELGDDLQAMGCKMLPTDFLPSTFGLPNGKTAPWYFAELKKLQAAGGPSPKGPCCCGSGAGNSLPGEAEFDVPQLEEAVQSVAVEAAVAATAAAVRAAGHGRVPAGLRLWADVEQRPATVAWDRQLGVAARSAVLWAKGHSHSTYAQPSRRQGGLGWGMGAPILPSYRKMTPHMAFVMDTSGSMMGDTTIQSCLSEVPALLKKCGGQLTFVSADAAVFASGKIRRVSGAQALLGGGGGTNFCPAFAHLKALKSRPSVVVYATDGYGTYPDLVDVRWCKIIWLMTTKFRPAYGTIIELPHAQ